MSRVQKSKRECCVSEIVFQSDHLPPHPPAPGAVKKFKTGGDREGEAPAEPHGARICWAIARQEARPPNFFTASLSPDEARGE